MRSIGATAVFETVAEIPPLMKEAKGFELLADDPPCATTCSTWGPAVWRLGLERSAAMAPPESAMVAAAVKAAALPTNLFPPCLS